MRYLFVKDKFVVLYEFKELEVFKLLDDYLNLVKKFFLSYCFFVFSIRVVWVI